MVFGKEISTWSRNRTETWPSESGERHALCAEPAGGKTVHSGRIQQQQIQSYFSRRASKLWHSRSDDSESEQDEDVMAAEEELAHENVRTMVLDEVALRLTQLFLTFSIYPGDLVT